MKNPAAQSLGRLGGQAKSAAKTAAVRENAKLGGWPKGKPRKPKRALRRSNGRGERPGPNDA
jgi:hypothetical protein